MIQIRSVSDLRNNLPLFYDDMSEIVDYVVIGDVMEVHRMLYGKRNLERML